MKKILLVGGSGSWGNELCRKLLLRQDVEEVRIFSRNEYKQVMMSRVITDPRVRFIIGDVRDYQAVYEACKEVDTVFHLAALKHVPVCEEQPLEAIKTNITGTENVIRACIANKVVKCVDVSTDKACSPNTLYGATKLVGEKLILNGNKLGTTKFICIRAGNVLGSAGSVVPLFIDQIQKNGHIYITNPNMTRFFMSLPEAIELLLQACEFNGFIDMLVMKMPSCTIGALAEVIIQRYGDEAIKMTTIGNRPGEKLHELLINEDEAINAYCYGTNYYALSTKANPMLGQKVNFKEYGSNTQTLMTELEIHEMLRKGGF